MPRRGENIRKRSDGRWEGRYAVLNPDGTRKYQSVYAKSYAEIKKKLTAAKNGDNIKTVSVDCKVTIEKIAPTYQELAEEWLENIKKERKYSTYIKYRNLYKKYIQPELGTVPNDPSDMCVLCIRNTEISESTGKSILTVARQIGHFAACKYSLPELEVSFARGWSCTRPTVEVFNAAEQSRLFHYLYADMDLSKMGIVLCLSTGIRLGEICSLRWEDIDFATKTLHIARTVQRIAVEGEKTKTSLLITSPKSLCSIREIPLSDSIVTLLGSFYKEGATYVFGDQKPLEPRTYENRFQKYLSDIQVESKNFHVLRHTFATNCVCSGADIKSLSEILGHSDVKITLNRYVHPSLEVKRQQLNTLSSIYGQYLGQ